MQLSPPVASAAVCSFVDDVLFYVPPIGCGGSVFFLVWYALLYVHSSFAIIFTRKRVKYVDSFVNKT